MNKVFVHNVNGPVPTGQWVIGTILLLLLLRIDTLVILVTSITNIVIVGANNNICMYWFN